jgi:hypothetical protein
MVDISKYFVIKIILAVIISLFCNLAYNDFLTQELSQKNYVLTVTSKFSDDTNLELYFDSGNGFNEAEKIRKKIIKGNNRTLFEIKNNGILLGIRLDFDQNPMLDSVQFNEITLSNIDKRIFTINTENIINNIYVTSENLKSIHNKFVFTNKNQADTYIIFKPIFELKTTDNAQILLYALPFLLLFLNDLFSILKNKIIQKNTGEIFACLLIVSIPLKESLTTFILLLWTLYAIYYLYRNKIFKLKSETYVFLILLIIPILFGRPSSYDQLNILLSFVLFIIIDNTNFSFNKEFLYKFFALILSILSVAILTSWFSNLFVYNAFKHPTIFEYFKNIKLENYFIRNWLPYTHATYYSILILFAIIFSKHLFKNGLIKKKEFLFIHIISIFTILVLGSRIAIILYLILLGANLFKHDKWLKYYLIISFSLITIVLIFFIETIDPIRHELWSLSINALIEKPFFGYGLGSFNDVINNFSNVDNPYYSQVSALNHSHNQYILYFLEIGSIGTLAIGISLAYIFIKKNKSFKKDYFISIFIFACLFLVESPLETSKSIILFSVILIITNIKDSNNSRKSIKHILNAKN